MKFSALMIIDILAIVAFWFVMLTGIVDGLDTILLFEEGFVYLLVSVSILTGFIIGGLYERWYNEHKEAPK